MRIGDRWIYEEKILGGNRKHPDARRWEQEDQTVAIQTIPEGVLVRRKVELLRGTAPPAYMGRGPESNILIHDNCVYYLNDSDSFGFGHGWDRSRGGLSSDFRTELATREALPDICFPLHMGQSWGDPSKGRDLWTVAGLGAKNPDDPASVTAESWRIKAELSSGDENYVWFKKSIGIVAKRTYHNGTFADHRVRLLAFQPGSPTR